MSTISKNCIEAFQTDDFYTILGITAEEKEDLTDAKLKKAYHKKSKEWHPDRHRAEAAVATRKFQVVKEAYRILRDPQMKAIYDDEGLVDDNNFVGFNDEADYDQEETLEEDTSGDVAVIEMAPIYSYQSDEENDEGVEYSSYEDSIDGYDFDVTLPEDEEMDYSSNDRQYSEKRKRGRPAVFNTRKHIAGRKRNAKSYSKRKMQRKEAEAKFAVQNQEYQTKKRKSHYRRKVFSSL